MAERGDRSGPRASAFTDLFIRRPVLAIVVNLVIIIAGLQAVRTLNVRQYPKLQSASVTVNSEGLSLGRPPVPFHSPSKEAGMVVVEDGSSSTTSRHTPKPAAAASRKPRRVSGVLAMCTSDTSFRRVG